MSYLRIDHVGKTFTRGAMETEVLQDITVDVEKGQYVSIIGHSGCGKSTLLNIVAGLAQPSRGGVLLENREVNDPGPDRAVVFQNHSLLPWLTVYDNVRLAVDKVFAATKSRRERHQWTLQNLDLVQMGHAKDKRPAEISGGMKQRVGIARALAMEPKVLLLDEPFGALDALTRAHLQDFVMVIHQTLGNTVLMITHDVDEAVLLSDRIVMMTNGPAARIGEVLEVPLARPRKRLELVAEPLYLKCRQRVLEFLYARQQGPAAAGRRVGGRAMARQRLVVVGNGMAGFACSRRSLERAPQDVSTSLWPARNRWPAYNRVLLSSLLAGETAACRRVAASQPMVRGARHRPASPAKWRGPGYGQAPRACCGRSAIPFDILVLATGSDPMTLSIPGAGLRGVATFSTLADIAAFERFAAERPAGGGDRRRPARDRGRPWPGATRCGGELVHLDDRLMERQLDAEAAALLAEAI